MHKTISMTIAVLPFISTYHARDHAIWQVPISRLNKRDSRLDSIHAIAARGSGDDAARCHPLSANHVASLHLRTALSANARRRARLSPDVLPCHAKAGPHAGNALRRSRSGFDSRFDRQGRWDVAFGPRRLGARGIGRNGALPTL